MTFQLRLKQTLFGTVTLMAVLTSGCAVREHAYDCTSVMNKDISDELVITPTSLRFQSVTYQFREEQGAIRVYEKTDKSKQVIFNAASGLLQITTEQWQCKKYTLSVEKS
jgi:hypothetical protein